MGIVYRLLLGDARGNCLLLVRLRLDSVIELLSHCAASLNFTCNSACSVSVERQPVSDKLNLFAGKRYSVRLNNWLNVHDSSL